MTTRQRSRGLVYLRRSTEKQEAGIHDQLRWAIAKAAEMRVALDVAPEDLEDMVRNGLAQHKAIFLDDGVSGSNLDRPGFQAFREAAQSDRCVSHVFIHLSDRFARPELAVEAMKMEIDLLTVGVTIVFSNRVSQPRQRGQHYFADDILLLHEYTQNGEFLTKLATRVLQSQIRLAEGGYWSGGIPPYGFGRVLVDSQGTEVRELAEGETVKIEGCHVKIKPTDEEKIKVWLYILHLHGDKGWGHKRIANHLDDLGIPSPHAGRHRRQNGASQEVSGKWWPESVKRLIKNEAIVGQCAFGKTARGKHRRSAADGPRTLDDQDRRDDGGARFIANHGERIVAATGYAASADEELFRKCQKLTEQRGRCQRGIPRGRDLGRYPLSSRIYDLTDGCGAVLFGHKQGDQPKYECSRYRQTGGRECHRHMIDGEATLRFVLDLLRQRIVFCGGREALRRRLRKLAERARPHRAQVAVNEFQLAEQRLASLESQLHTIEQNLALATSDATFKAVERQFEAKQREVDELRHRVDQLRASVSTPGAVGSIEEEIEAAMALFDELERIVNEPAARADIAAMLQALDLRIWLRFMANPNGKKPRRVLQGGIVTIGEGHDPLTEQKSDGDHPPDADGGGADSESLNAGTGRPAIKSRHQEGASFRKGTVGDCSSAITPPTPPYACAPASQKQCFQTVGHALDTESVLWHADHALRRSHAEGVEHRSPGSAVPAAPPWVSEAQPMTTL